MHGEALFDLNFAIFGGGALRGFASKRILCKSNGKRFIFQRNHVQIIRGNQVRGGAVFTTLSYVELEGILFEGNTAWNGGAISSKDVLLHILTCNFYNNSAVNDGSAVSFFGTYGFAIFNGTNSFQWN